MVTKNINEWFRKTFRRQKIAPDNGMIKSPNVLSRIMNVTKKNKIHSKNILIKSTSESLLTPSEQQRNQPGVNEPNFSGDRRSPSELVVRSACVARNLALLQNSSGYRRSPSELVMQRLSAPLPK